MTPWSGIAKFISATHGHALRYLVASAVSFAFNMVITIGLHSLVNVSEYGSFAVALSASFLFNFLVMRYYVFQSVDRSLWSQFRLYSTGAVAFRSLEFVVFSALLSSGAIPYDLLAAAVLAGSMIGKFFYHRAISFNHEVATRGKSTT